MLTCLLFVLAAPHIVKAEDDDEDERPRHRIRATELAGIGIGTAALIGVAGYFVLRRRHTV
jgi:hypothetical protein